MNIKNLKNHYRYTRYFYNVDPYIQSIIKEHSVMKLKDGIDLRHWNKLTEMLFAERNRQINKFGVQEWDSHKWNSILTEEVGEFAQSIIDYDSNESAESLDHVIEEITQVSMVAINILDCLLQKKEEEYL